MLRQADPSAISGQYQPLPIVVRWLAAHINQFIADSNSCYVSVEFLSRHGLQSVKNIGTGNLDSASIQVGGGAGSRWGCVGNAIRAGRLDFYSLRLNGKYLCRHLQHLGIYALPHFNGTRTDAHAPVGVHMHQRPRLIHPGIGERDAETNRHQGQSFFVKYIGGIESHYLRTGCLNLIPGNGFIPAGMRFAFGFLSVQKLIAGPVRFFA